MGKKMKTAVSLAVVFFLTTAGLAIGMVFQRNYYKKLMKNVKPHPTDPMDLEGKNLATREKEIDQGSREFDPPNVDAAVNEGGN